MKAIIFLILFFTSAYSLHHGPFVKDYVAENHIDFKDLRYSDYKNVVLDEFTIMFKLNIEEIGEKTYYLTVISDKNSLVYTNVEYELINNIMIVKLDKYQKDEIFFKYIYDKPKIAEFRSDCITSFEYEYLLKYEGILYGIAYGIIFCAFLYYLIIYFSTKMICFLYYSLMQLFALLSLVGFMYFSYKSFSPVIIHTLVDLAETLAFIFTFLFAQNILKTKEKIPYIYYILNIFIVVNVLDLFAILVTDYSVLYEYMSFYIGFLVPTIAGLIAVYKGDKSAIVYTLGWFVMSVIIYISQKGLFAVSGIYIIHIGTPLESLIFSFALGIMLQTIVKEKNEKERLLIHQSKLASMGEMINNIAHQWRQPLTHLGFINMNFQLALEDKNIDKKYLLEKIDEADEQLDFMSKTIDNFRDFYKINKEKESFFVSVAVQKAIDIMKPIFKKLDINLEFEIEEDKELFAYENEYSQVVLNLLTNAKNIFVSRDIKEPRIKITLGVENDLSTLTLSDNAGGIEKEFLDKIFEPYFTTNEKGSGIGLYMSKMIIETHFKGKIEAQNYPLGAKFIIKV